MKNIEKYEEELRPFGTRFAITKYGKFRSCKEFRCGDCAFHYALDSDCYVARLKWLMKEYKEPILSQEGKEFLKQLIAPFISNEIVSVCKNEDLQILRIDYKIGWTCYSKKVLGEKWDWFKNLNPEKLYTLEELGLRERLKGE